MTIAWQVDAPTVTTASDAALVLNDISKVYGEGALAVQALRGVSLTVRPGELVAVMGPSGSGKSSLLQIAGGLDVPSAGSVDVAGTNLIGLSHGALASVRRRRIGYVFQSLNLISSLTAVENVALPLELDGSSVRLARGAARAALVDVGLEVHIDKFPSELSGGQQQRVAIARALVGDRQLLLADEPTGALDSVTGESVLRLIRSKIDAGAAGMLVTHEARHAAWADRTVFLADGLIVDDTGGPGSPDDLLTGPR